MCIFVLDFFFTSIVGSIRVIAIACSCGAYIWCSREWVGRELPYGSLWYIYISLYVLNEPPEAKCILNEICWKCDCLSIYIYLNMFLWWCLISRRPYRGATQIKTNHPGQVNDDEVKDFWWCGAVSHLIAHGYRNVIPLANIHTHIPFVYVMITS